MTLAAGTAHICDCLMLACTRLSGIGTTGIVGLELCHHFRILGILASGRGSWSLGNWSRSNWSRGSPTLTAGTAHTGDLGMLARACIGSIGTAGLRGSELLLHNRICNILAGGRGSGWRRGCHGARLTAQCLHLRIRTGTLRHSMAARYILVDIQCFLQLHIGHITAGSQCTARLRASTTALATQLRNLLVLTCTL